MSLTEKVRPVTPLVLEDTHQSSEGVTSSRQSSDRQQGSPRLRPAFQRQCSSPSFVDSYNRYVERLQQDDASKNQQKSVQEPGQEQSIKASFPGDAPSMEATRERSPDSDKDITDSSFSSWPASASNDRSRHAAQPSAESLPLSPRHRRRQSGEWNAGSHHEGKAESLMTGGSVAAAVEDLESRCRSASQPNLSPRWRSHQGVARHPSKLMARPCSPWPEPNYQPDHSEEDVDIERGLPGPACVDADRKWPPALGQEGETPEHVACCASLARVFEQKPGLQHQLMAMLAEDSSLDNEVLKLQVQELLKDHPDLIEMLNAQFRKKSTETGKLRQALYSTASGAATYRPSRRQAQAPQDSLGSSAGHHQIPGVGEKEKAMKPHLWRRCLQKLVPPPHKLYTPWSTFVIIAAVICIFFYMAGGYPLFPDSTLMQNTNNSAPSGLRYWMRFSDNAPYSFSFDYLLLWGGQYLPAIKEHQGWRWITAAFLHVNFQHMLANMLLLAVVGGLLERRYGTVRISIVLVISTLGAAFFSGAFEDKCTQIVGASGAVMGFVGMTIADIAINSGDIFQVVLRLVIIAAAVVFFIVTAVTEAKAYTSSWSHLGGFVCGLFPGFLFIPDFQDARWRKAQAMASRLTKGNKDGSNRPCSPSLPLVSNASRNHVDESAVMSNQAPQSTPWLPLASRSASQGWPSAHPEAIQEEDNALPSPRSWQTDHAAPLEVADNLEHPSEDLNPNSFNPPPHTQLLTEAPSDGGHLRDRTSPFISRHFGRCSARRTQQRRMRRCWQRLTGIPIHLWLGGFALVGVFSALPTYIYVKLLPSVSCAAH